MKYVKRILVVCLFFVCLTAFGQKQIENKLTEEHQNIKGTKISLIPPAGFTDATDFSGLQQMESGSGIMIFEVPAPYSETSKAITKEPLLSKGIQVSKIENLTINRLPAILATGVQNAYGNTYTQYTLVFGTEKETIMINGVFPKKFKKMGEKVKKSMLSVYYDANKELKSFEFPDFSIDLSGTKLKLCMNLFGVVLFTVDGLMPPTSSNDKTEMVIVKQSFDTIQENKKTFAINSVKKRASLDAEKIEYMNEISIDGISGYEIYEKGKYKEGSGVINNYYVILFGDNFYYLFVGATNDETEASIEQIKKAIQTFKRK
jgi:hypothetical protein